MAKMIRPFLILCTLSISTLARAEDVDQEFYFRGFASLVATKTSDANVGWRIQNQPISQARSKAGQWALTPESLIGLQADFQPQSTISATVQMLAMNRSKGEIEPDLELAFIRYKPQPNWQIRLGRIWTPSFLNSETRYIGFSNTTIRNTNYTLYQITNLNGGDVQYKTNLADGVITAAVYAGNNRYQLPDNAAGKEDFFHLPLIAGGFVSWESENFLVRGSYTRIQLERNSPANATLIDVTVPALKAAFADGSCTICDQEAQKWERNWRGVKYEVATISARYTQGNLVSSAELIRRKTDATFPDASGFDLDIAYSMNHWTPYANYLNLRTSSNNAPVFANSLPQFASLNATYAAGHIDRSIVTTGLKYAIDKHTALRGEIMQVRFVDAKAGVGFAPTVNGAIGVPARYHVFSLSLDFIF